MKVAIDFPPFSFMNKLNSNEHAKLNSIAHKQAFPKGDYVFQAGQVKDTIFILLDGRVKIIRLSVEGRELIQWFCLPGEIFGLSEDLHSFERSLSAQTISNSNLLCISKQQFNLFLVDNPGLALHIIKQLTTRLRILGDMLLNITSENAQAKFINLIQRLIDCYGHTSGNTIHIDIYLTHQEMADMIGVCRQTVSSMLGRFKREGILNSDRTGIHINMNRPGFSGDTFV